MAMNQKELLELARATMRKRGGEGRGRGGARALARGGAPSEVPDEGPLSVDPSREGHGDRSARDRTSDVTGALSRIEALDQKLAEISEVRGAMEDIQAAEARVLEAADVKTADASIAALDQEILDQHTFRTFDPSAQRDRMPRDRETLRNAFKFSLLLGKPGGYGGYEGF